MTRFAHYLARLRWPLGVPRRQTAGDAGEKGQERDAKETGELVSSWGRWPGHEANFPILSRLLWEIGKDGEKTRREEEEKTRASDDESGTG